MKEPEDFKKEVEFNTEWLQTTEGDEVECISIENLVSLLDKYNFIPKRVWNKMT